MGINKFLGFVWSLIAVILLIILVINIRGKRFNIKNGKSIIQGSLFSTDIFDADKIDSLDINLVSESLNVVSHNENVVKVELYCTKETAPVVDLNNSVLSIKSYKNRKINVHMFENHRVIVYVPYKRQFSGANVNLVSGSIHIENLDCKTMKCNAVSGSTHIDDCNFETASFGNVSGSMHLSNSSSETLDIGCTSGSVNVDGSYDGINIKSVSGSVNTRLNKPITKNSSIVSTSGSINIGMSGNNDLKIEYKSNGTYKNSITGTTGKSGTDVMGSGAVNLFLKATSGSIHIN